MFRILYQRAYHIVTKLSEKCQRHFFPTPDVEVKYESMSLSKFVGAFICFLAAMLFAVGVFAVELLFSIAQMYH